MFRRFRKTKGTKDKAQGKQKEPKEQKKEEEEGKNVDCAPQTTTSNELVVVVFDEVTADIKRPPMQNDRYPLPLTPKTLPNQEVSFYIPVEEEEEEGSSSALACTLIRCASTPPLAENDNAASTVHRIEEGGFTIDTSKPVVIVCHGQYSWRNQMLLAHLAGNLSKQLDCHALRFDFRGNGHSPGQWRYMAYEREAQDLQTVVEFVRNTMKCRVLCVVGHSKGVQAVLKLATNEEDQEEEENRIPYYVGLSGRCFLPDDSSMISRLFTKERKQALEENQKLEIMSPMGHPVNLLYEDLEDFVEMDSTTVSYAESAKFLIVHGNADTVVPVQDAHELDKVIPNSKLIVVENADHNFNGMRHIKLLVSVIVKHVQS